MMKLIVNFAIIALLALQTSAQIPFLGSCPTTSAVTGFNLNNYLGKWYEIRSYFAFFTSGSICTQAEYSLNPNGTVQVLNKAVRNGTPTSILGYATLIQPGIGKLIVNFPSTGAPQMTTENYVILGTDYTNYAVVHSCTSLFVLNFQFAWVLSRTRTLSSDSQAAVSEILTRNRISVKHFSETSQTNCPALY